jgi:hypothetical protein
LTLPTQAILATIADAGFELTVRMDSRRVELRAVDHDSQCWIVRGHDLDSATVELAVGLGFDLEE